MAYQHANLNSVTCNIADTDLMLSAFSSTSFSTVLQDLLEENCQLQVRMGSWKRTEPFSITISSWQSGLRTKYGLFLRRINSQRQTTKAPLKSNSLFRNTAKLLGVRLKDQHVKNMIQQRYEHVAFRERTAVSKYVHMQLDLNSEDPHSHTVFTICWFQLGLHN